MACCQKSCFFALSFFIICSFLIEVQAKSVCPSTLSPEALMSLIKNGKFKMEKRRGLRKVTEYTLSFSEHKQMHALIKNKVSKNSEEADKGLGKKIKELGLLKSGPLKLIRLFVRKNKNHLFDMLPLKSAGLLLNIPQVSLKVSPTGGCAFNVQFFVDGKQYFNENMKLTSQ